MGCKQLRVIMFYIVQFSRIQTVGPELKNRTQCLECSDYTDGDRCEQCRGGYFRLPRMPPTDPCTK